MGSLIKEGQYLVLFIFTTTTYCICQGENYFVKKNTYLTKTTFSLRLGKNFFGRALAVSPGGV